MEILNFFPDGPGYLCQMQGEDQLEKMPHSANLWECPFCEVIATQPGQVDLVTDTQTAQSGQAN